MKLSLHRPRPTDLEPLMAAARSAAPRLVPGARFDDSPDGFRLASTRQRVGSGEADFEHAKQLLCEWAFLPASAHPCPDTPPQRPGENLLLLVRTFGVWAAMPARVLESIATTDGVQRAGFVYTALPGHVAQGYERFLLEQDPATGDVTFELRAVARPAQRLVRLVRPAFSLMQLRFRLGCMRQMRNGIRAARPASTSRRGTRPFPTRGTRGGPPRSRR
jgi:uncharacterized protein (UPF0548 family)